MAKIETTCQCGCGEPFLARAGEVRAGRAKYKNMDHRAAAMRQPDAKRPGQGAAFKSLTRQSGLSMRKLIGT